eukprot:g2546.t1
MADTKGPAVDEDDLYALEQVELDDDSDDNFEYTELPVDGDDFGGLDDDEDEDEDEDLETALASIRSAAGGGGSRAGARSAQSGRGGGGGGLDVGGTETLASTKAHVRPAVVDDFIRNFLIKRGMARTLDEFNTEWYEMQSKGKLSEEDVGVVPDIYLRNQDLDEQVKLLKDEVDKMKEIAAKAQGTWDKFRKERDFHRMHHRRVVQEKKKLIVDIKRLKKYYAHYEPTLKEIRNKYEVVMKEKMLMRLERDRLQGKCQALEAQVMTLEQQSKKQADAEPEEAKAKKPKKGRDTKYPDPADAVNPFLNLEFDATPAETFSLMKTFKGHMNSVSAVAFHPKKPVLATVSDDETWKLWSVPTGELIMSGEGHKCWLAGVAFHPHGTHLATTSGDCTVKLWDFSSTRCAATFTDHTQVVWDCAFHHDGDFMVSCSMDHTTKLWDLNSERCRQTFRGHVDSINTVCFQPFSNNICTASGDKTVSLWDIRSGLCIQTFYGHSNACNDAAFNVRGDTIASCDADGVVKLWDVRMVAERAQFVGGEYPINKVAFDRSGTRISAATDDGSIKIFMVPGGGEGKDGGDDAGHDLERPLAELHGHEDAVQSVAFEPQGKFMVSGSSDCTFRVWSQG